MKEYTVILSQREINALWMVSRSVAGHPMRSYRGAISDKIGNTLAEIASPEVKSIYYEKNHTYYLQGNIIFKNEVIDYTK